MNSSGIKRGMAALAITAVAVTGVPALAMADSVDSQVTTGNGPNGVELYNINTSTGGTIDASAKPDGTDSTVRLEAGGGINVATVTFQIARNGGAFADVATVGRNDDGAFSFELNPTSFGAFAGDNIEIRVFNTNNPAFEDFSGTQRLRNATSATTQTINIAAGSAKGYFRDPCTGGADNYVAITGTTSVTSTASGDRPGLARMDGNGNEQDFTFNTSNGGDGTFEGTLDVTPGANPAGYLFDNPALPPAEPDQLVVRAVTDTTSAPDDQTDDFEAFTLYRQTITTLTAVVGSTTAPDPAPITVTVLDQNGNPVAGAEVRDGFSGAFVGTTDGRGQVFTTQNDNTTFFYANADCNNGFSPAAGDKRSNDASNQAAQITITSNPGGCLAVGSSVTETITVKNANGSVIANRQVKITRTGPGSEQQVLFRTTDANGVVTYTFTGSTGGTATVTAAIDGPPFSGTFTFASATDPVQFGNCSTTGGRVRINPVLVGRDFGLQKDKLRVSAHKADGAVVKLFRIRTLNGPLGNRVLIKTGRLNANGVEVFFVKDRNGNSKTRYQARVGQTSDTLARRTNPEIVR